tara:strand:+ start:859 stop:3015 length:2157 start_codon:yes stop_codon:yes gene_type:complete
METINKYYKAVKAIHHQENTIEEYKNTYQSVIDGEQEIKAELKTKNVKVLKNIIGQLGGWTDSRNKKDDLINKIYRTLFDYFLIGRNLTWTFGQGTHDDALKSLIEGTTAETLKAFYISREEKKQAFLKSIENPQTLEEFRTFIDHHGEDKLTPEQKTAFEALKAEVTLSRQKREQEQSAVIQKIDVENVDFELYPTKHSKTGADIFTVLMNNRVKPEEFKTLSVKAKQLGGYYSRYSDSTANPPIKAGFNFKTEAEAVKFIGLKESNQSNLERKEEQKEEVIKNAGERMRERANLMIEKAQESLNQERRTNTHRQASQAGRAEEKASEEIIFAKKLLSIADGFDNGKIKFLHALRNGKQLEQLEQLLRRGYYKRLQSLNLTYTEKQNEVKNPVLDIDFVEFPYPCYGSDVVKSIFLKHEDTAGMKQNIKHILSHLKAYQDKNELITLEGDYIITLYKETALKIRDKWEQSRILDSIKDYERIQKMGLTNIAILRTALRELTTLSSGAEISQEQKNELELRNMEREFISKKIPGFFPTPKPLIDKMLSIAKVFEGETILEPSAGLGHIATEIRAQYPNNELHLIEFNYSLCEALNKKGFAYVENMNFLAESRKYDVIFMNPPFENHQDIEHVQHAFKLLKDGGRLVAIMAGNKNGESKTIKEFNSFVEDVNGYYVENEAGSFKSAFNSTGVNTVTLYLEKAHQEEEKALDLFSSIENN